MSRRKEQGTALRAWESFSERTVNYIGGCLRVTLPAAMCDRLGIDAGDSVTFSMVDDTIVVRRLE